MADPPRALGDHSVLVAVRDPTAAGPLTEAARAEGLSLGLGADANWNPESDDAGSATDPR